MALQKKTNKQKNPNPGCSVAIKKGGKLQKGEVKWLQEIQIVSTSLSGFNFNLEKKG